MARTLLTSIISAAALAVALAAPAPLAAHGPASEWQGAERKLTRASTAGVASRAAARAWCGERRADDDVENEVDNGAARYHAIYAVPADGRSRFRAVAADLQADAFTASGVLERGYGRAIRFDLGTSCGPQYLDISEVRLSLTTAELGRLSAAGGAQTFHAVSDALRTAGFPVMDTGSDAAAAVNYLVWLDGPAPNACGEAHLMSDRRRTPENANNRGGKLALVYQHRQSFCGYRSVLHEIGHNLGAVQQGAPNAPDGAHCEDAWEDVMCNASAPTATPGADVFFDYGNDDYWDPPNGAPLPWWTVNLSRFLCDDAGCNRPARATETSQTQTSRKSRVKRKQRRQRAQARKSARQRAAKRQRRDGSAKSDRRPAKRRPSAS